MACKFKFLAVVFHFTCRRCLKLPLPVLGLMCCFLLSSILPLLGICYLAWGSICIQDCTIPVLPVISKVLLFVFVQFAAAPIAFTVAQEEINDFSLRDFLIEFQKCHFIPGLFFFLISENFLLLRLPRVLLLV